MKTAEEILYDLGLGLEPRIDELILCAMEEYKNQFASQSASQSDGELKDLVNLARYGDYKGEFSIWVFDPADQREVIKNWKESHHIPESDERLIASGKMDSRDELIEAYEELLDILDNKNKHPSYQKVILVNREEELRQKIETLKGR